MWVWLSPPSGVEKYTNVCRMSTKKYKEFCMKWNHSIFIKNINHIVKKHCDAKQVRFNEIIGQRDAVTRWKKESYRPSLEILLEITEKFPVTIDWLLTGKESKGCSEEEFMAQWPEEIRNACRQLKDVFLSDHPVIKPALISNLAAFQYSVEKEKSQDNKIEEQTQKLKKQDQEIRKIREQLKQLENWHKAEQGTGTGGAASSSTGKSKT